LKFIAKQGPGGYIKAIRRRWNLPGDVKFPANPKLIGYPFEQVSGI